MLTKFVFTLALVIVPMVGRAASPELLTSGIAGASGSTVGPDGALYVTESATGSVLRVNPQTGAKAVFATGLPIAHLGLGGAIDVAFLDDVAYVLVTLVGPDVGGASTVGLYRVDGASSFTIVADIGAFNIAHPPAAEFQIDVASGLQFALQPYRDGFLVTDGHLNRVLHVSLDGAISVFSAFDNIVPTGIDVLGSHLLVAFAGPTPHVPEDGRVMALDHKDGTATEVAAGAPLLVDVEFRGNSVYALSQGNFPGGPPASPASPNTGALVKMQDDGSLATVVAPLNQPTSIEFIGNGAYIVTLGGEIWRLDLK
jgi:hypothetical protein